MYEYCITMLDTCKIDLFMTFALLYSLMSILSGPIKSHDKSQSKFGMSILYQGKTFVNEGGLPQGKYHR